MKTTTNVVRAIPAGEFKAKCLAFFDEVETKQRSFVVTKRGRPVARVVPLPSSVRGSLRGTLLYEEDLLLAIETQRDAGS
ncbi:MAG: type II toxin-antitoxin system Phd/YefM family antitoxin [Myxococcales bacterium]|nr:type II toxin-antitoxin system Phd/YefM family antitoxin [Myxococcales bacterium]